MVLESRVLFRGVGLLLLVAGNPSKGNRRSFVVELEVRRD